MSRQQQDPTGENDKVDGSRRSGSIHAVFTVPVLLGAPGDMWVVGAPIERVGIPTAERRKLPIQWCIGGGGSGGVDGTRIRVSKLVGAGASHGKGSREERKGTVDAMDGTKEEGGGDRNDGNVPVLVYMGVKVGGDGAG